MRVLVTGGTGRLGSAVVEELGFRGHDPVVVSHRPAPDRVVVNLSTGVGLPAAVEKADAIVHAASDPRGDARVTDVEGTRRLALAGIPVLYVSIVGVDKHPYKYYKIKRQGEITLAGAGGRWTVLRSTQFHALLDDLLMLSRKSIGGRIPGLRGTPGVPVLVPRGFRTQPVDHFEVANRIVDLVEGGPTGRIEQFGGPEALESVALAREWAKIRGGRIIGVPVLGRSASAFRKGLALPGPDVPTGKVTWTDYLHGAFGKAAS